MHNLFADRFYLEPFAVWGAKKANRTISKALTYWDLSTKRFKTINW